jgi:type IX secretion system PorP/SprF family membrane protein
MYLPIRPIVLLLFLCSTAALSAQQDAAFTKYIFNGLAYNPAYAGSNEHLSAHLIHRRQWIGLEGAPVSSSLSVHSPLKKEKIALGFNFIGDQVGPLSAGEFAFSYVYRVKVNERWRLAAGVQGSVYFWASDATRLILNNRNDDVFFVNTSVFRPNFGAGLYLSSERGYVGLSCPRMLEDEIALFSGNGRNFRHYYLTAGWVFPLREEDIVFRPTLLLKGAGIFSKVRESKNAGSPTAVDIDAAFGFFKTFWIGAAYRGAVQRSRSSDDSADLWAAWYLRNGLRLGIAYDFTVSDIRKATNSGSAELMLGYEFDVKVKKVATPRYF